MKRSLIILSLSFILLLSSSCYYKKFVGETMRNNRRDVCVLPGAQAMNNSCVIISGFYKFTFKVEKLDAYEYKIEGFSEKVGPMDSPLERNRVYYLVMIRDERVVDSVPISIRKNPFQKEFHCEEDFDAISIVWSARPKMRRW
jgi:hypothetical protein